MRLCGNSKKLSSPTASLIPIKAKLEQLPNTAIFESKLPIEVNVLGKITPVIAVPLKAFPPISVIFVFLKSIMPPSFFAS